MYDRFFSIWSLANENLPVKIEARNEYAALN